MIYVLVALGCGLCFCLGVVLGITDCKRTFGIERGVTPEQYDAWIDEICAKAYGTYVEVE